jgi:hypothetical protein
MIAAFASEEREAICAVLPPSADHRAALDAIAELRRDMQIHPRQVRGRKERNSDYMAEREQRREAEKLVLRLIDISRDLPDTPSLHEVHKQILLKLAGLDALIWANSGAKDSLCAIIYTAVLRIWTDLAGGELRYSQRDGTPCGPLIRFLSVVVPLMLPPDVPTPSPHTLRTIVDGEKERREHTRNEIRAKLRKSIIAN